MVEATAGALGTMVTCVLLYPVDIAKLHMQAGKSKAGALATMRKIVAEDSFSALYKGLPPKAVHVIINNYLYFYIYEWLKAKRSAAGLKASTLVNTALGVIAGVANLTVTLPLDTLVVRVQADGQNYTIKDAEQPLTLTKATDGLEEGTVRSRTGSGLLHDCTPTGPSA